MDTTTGQIKEFKDEEDLDKAIASGNWIKLDRMPNPKCTRCYGRGHLGKNLETGKYVPCRCVKERDTKRVLDETAVPTTERLARALEGQNDPRLESMIGDARAGVYDDYKSPKPMPIMMLVSQLKGYGLGDLAQRAIDGEFAATPEEGKEWFEKEGKDLLGIKD